jgi:iron complex outermembrane receptor protein
MRLNGGVNYNVNTITHVIPNPPQLASLGPNFVIFDRLSQGNLTVGLPKTKIYLSDTWTWSDFTVTPRFVRYGGFTALQDNPTLDRSFNAKWVTDLEMAWQVTPMLNIAVGAYDLFNVYPSPNGSFNAALGSGQYTTTQAFGFTGGFYYARVGVSL